MQNNIESLFVPYQIALDMKSIGFDEPCLSGYSKSTEKLEFYSGPLITKDSFTVDAPLYQQCWRWLYQKLDIEKDVMPLDTESQQLLLKELIDKVSSKHLLV